MKIFAKTIEDEALKQLSTIENHPAFGEESNIRIMPDVHSGTGCVIGFTAKLVDKVVPNVIGVDIGCGMIVTRFNKKYLPEDFKKLEDFISKNIPSGFSVNNKVQSDSDFLNLNKLKCFEQLVNVNRINLSLGSLGGGNHFIEIATDFNYAYLVIHSGSRNLGKQIAEIYQNKAIDNQKNIYNKSKKDIIDSLIKNNKSKEIERELSLFNENFICLAPDLCYLDGNDLKDYLHDMRFAVEWAKQNRIIMSNKILDFLGVDAQKDNVFTFQSIHNFIDEHNIIRKGACSATNGEPFIVPLNMRDGSLICLGKGNEDWNCSAPHGAGRIMSRSQAFKTLRVKDMKEDMKGISSWSIDESTLDESPRVYKDAKEIEELISDTGVVLTHIWTKYNFKASKERK